MAQNTPEQVLIESGFYPRNEKDTFAKRKSICSDKDSSLTLTESIHTRESSVQSNGFHSEHPSGNILDLDHELQCREENTSLTEEQEDEQTDHNRVNTNMSINTEEGLHILNEFIKEEMEESGEVEDQVFDDSISDKENTTDDQSNEDGSHTTSAHSSSELNSTATTTEDLDEDDLESLDLDIESDLESGSPMKRNNRAKIGKVEAGFFIYSLKTGRVKVNRTCKPLKENVFKISGSGPIPRSFVSTRGTVLNQRRTRPPVGEREITKEEKRVSFYTEVSLQLRREFQHMARNHLVTCARFAMTSIMAILIGIMFLDVGRVPIVGKSNHIDCVKTFVILNKDLTAPYCFCIGPKIGLFESQLNFQSHFGALLLTLLLPMFGTALPTLLAFPDERPVFLREYSTNHYGVVSYFISRLFMEGFITFLQIFSMVSYQKSSLPYTTPRFDKSILTFFFSILGRF